MAYGLRVYNEGQDELTLSDSGRVFSYAGKAALSTITQPTVATGRQSRFNGFSRYTFNWDGDIVSGVELVNGANCGIISQTRSGSTHTIDAYFDNGVRDAQGFGTQYEIGIHVWAESRTASGYGIAIYDDLGNILSVVKSPPLSYQNLLLCDGTTGVTVPSIANIIMVGSNLSSRRTSVAEGTPGRYLNRQDAPCWRLDSSLSTISPQFYTRQQDNEDGAASTLIVYRPSTALVIDRATLT